VGCDPKQAKHDTSPRLYGQLRVAGSEGNLGLGARTKELLAVEPLPGEVRENLY
jgi:hypothetical protein